MKILKKYPLTVICIVGIWVLCMTPWIPETPLSHVSLIDKWTHIVMYFGLCMVMWIEYILKHKAVGFCWRSVMVYTLVLPVFMGGLIEICQAYLTGGHRSGEWMDVLADGIGVVIAFAIGSVFLMKNEK